MANNDYDDEFDETADPIDEEPIDDDEIVIESDSADAPASKDKEKEKDILADAETLTVSSKEEARRQLEEEMERFLAAGGKIRRYARTQAQLHSHRRAPDRAGRL